MEFGTGSINTPRVSVFEFVVVLSIDLRGCLVFKLGKVHASVSGKIFNTVQLREAGLQYTHVETNVSPFETLD